MKIEHIAIWTKNLEEMKTFYEKIFNAVSGEKYINKNINFESYFLTFKNGARLELMSRPDLQTSCQNSSEIYSGYAHMAFSVGTENDVDKFAEKLKKEGVILTSNPRRTGDGYYEFAFLDIDGNLIEITAD